MKFKEKYPGIYQVLFCSLVVVATMIFAMNYYTMALISLDDMGMRNIISGLYTGKPDGHAYFIYYALAQILAWMYTVYPYVSWYSLFLLFANYGCMWLLLYRVMGKAKKHKEWKVLGVTVVFLICWMKKLVFPEWTATSGLMAAMAIFWYGTIPESNSKWRKFIEYAIPLFLLFLSFNLRHSVAEMYMPIAVIVFFSKLYFQGNKRDRGYMITEISFLIVCVVCVLGSYFINRVQYQSEEWQEARKLTQDRASLFDLYGYPEYEGYEDLYKENGISKEAYECLREDYNFTLVCTGSLSSENLRPIAEKAKEIYDSKYTIWTRILTSVRQRLAELFSSLYDSYNIVYFTEILMILYCAIKEKDKYYLFLSMFTICVFEVLWLYLYYLGKLPDRVGHSLCIGQILTMFFLLWKKDVEWKFLSFPLSGRMVVFSAALLIGAEFAGIESNSNYYISMGKLRAEIKEYCEENKSNLYFRDYYSFASIDNIWGGEYTGANMRPFNDWMVNFPLKDPFGALDGSQDLCSWISKKSNIYLLVDKGRADSVCDRQEAFFASKGIACVMTLTEEIETTDGKIIQVYQYVCV